MLTDNKDERNVGNMEGPKGASESPCFLVLEDHPLVLDRLCDTLMGLFPNCSVAYAGDRVSEAVAALELLGGTERLCAIVDADLGDGRSVTDNVSPFVNSKVPVVLVSALVPPESVQEAVLAGAGAYVPKNRGADQYRGAIDAVMAGKEWMSADVASALAPVNDRVALTEEQRRALVLCGSGLSLAGIAHRMEVTPAVAEGFLNGVWRSFCEART